MLLFQTIVLKYVFSAKSLLRFFVRPIWITVTQKRNLSDSRRKCLVAACNHCLCNWIWITLYSPAFFLANVFPSLPSLIRFFSPFLALPFFPSRYNVRRTGRIYLHDANAFSLALHPCTQPISERMKWRANAWPHTCLYFEYCGAKRKAGGEWTVKVSWTMIRFNRISNV